MLKVSRNIHDAEHHFGFADDFAGDFADAFCLGDVAPSAAHLDFDDELIAGTDWFESESEGQVSTNNIWIALVWLVTVRFHNLHVPL